MPRTLPSHGVAVSSRFVDLAEPSLRVRVLESGEGPPVLVVAGDGGSPWSHRIPTRREPAGMA
jgi:hypothetical protein